MTVTKDELEKLAKLARLRFTQAELDKFADEFDDIVAFADTINQSVEGDAQALRSVASERMPFGDLREDSVAPSLPNEKIVSNVEDRGGFFAVERSRR